MEIANDRLKVIPTLLYEFAGDEILPEGSIELPLIAENFLN